MGSETTGSATGTDSTFQLRGNRRSGRNWPRWLPALAVPVVIAAAALAGTLPANAGDPLPQKTPAEVLALAATHHTQAFSGTIEQSSDLGLPALPSTGASSDPASAGGAASVVEFLSGQHTARVYMDGTAKARIQVVDRLAERDIVRRDSDVWFYSSKDNSAAHLTLPARAADLPLAAPQAQGEDPAAPAQPGSPSESMMPTPEDLARQLLEKVDPTTAVTVGADVEVAGRAAYNLLLEPRSEATLVGQVAIAVDGETGMPLAVQVTARGAGTPAFRLGFTALSLGTPDDSLFTFSPPPGSTVKELQVPDPGQKTYGGHNFGDHAGDGVGPEHPAVTGQGWGTILRLPAAAAGAPAANSFLEDPLLAQAAVVVPGGRLVSTALLNVLITDDGRVFAGMVPPDRLQAAASAAP
ncbi:LolA family protein [Pseudarthrobacter sp. 1G09]|uniref:LolA family protein n=1 Tax=Pseudarthrobacter sp. 1G09 TaxID=3416178 RepID=UPI003CF0639C